MKRKAIGMLLFAGTGVLTLSVALANQAAPTTNEAATTTTDDPAARELFREASGRRYRWDKDLKGFSADVTLEQNGKSATGTVTVKLGSAKLDIQVASDNPALEGVVRELVGVSVVHARPNNFDESYAKTTFALAGPGRHGGTVIKMTGHSIFKDFTVKDGFIVQNHTGGPGFETEVNVEQVAWVAELGKTVPKELLAKIVSGEGDSKVTRWRHSREDWTQVDGYWFPNHYRLTITEGESKTESALTLANIRVERTPAKK